MDELIRLSKKAANEWRNTDAYYQAAVLIDSLCKRLEKAENRNPQTNADRIRAMSDEELAKWLCSILTAECCDRSCPARYMCDFNDNGLIKWLKQPAEET